MTGTRERAALLYDLTTGECVSTYVGHTAAVYGVQLLPAASLMLSCGDDKSVRLWDTRSTRCVAALTGHRAGVMCVQADSYKIASGSYDHRVNIWDMRRVCSAAPPAAATAAPVPHPAFLYALFGHGDPVFCLQFDETKLVSGSGDKTIKIYDFANVRHRLADDVAPLHSLKINGVTTDRQYLSRSHLDRVH